MTAASIQLPDGSNLEIRDDAWADLPRWRGATPDEPPVRLAYAASHVVMNEAYRSVAHAPGAPGDPEAIAASIDWEQTAEIRRRLASYGFGIAEAMDTAQRFEIGWPAARRLIETCAESAGPMGFIAGAGTDHRDDVRNERDLIDAVVEQIALIRSSGGSAIVLPMPWLSLRNSEPQTYVDVYRGIAEGAGGDLLVHWLGPMFLASMEGYFPGDSFDRIMAECADVYRGVKLSLLDASREIEIRDQLMAHDQVVLTGDDFNFGQLIVGDGAAASRWIGFDEHRVGIGHASHALLGILDGIPLPAARALGCLERGDSETAAEILTRCEALGRVVFEAPTSDYKVGLAFLAWLNGWQDRFLLPNHIERCRDVDHLVRVVRAANDAGCFEDAALVVERLGAFLRFTT